ncbi:actin-binding LIM 1-like [Brachionus plicatilis]|uniref:Actin-binding LIM 1-like n=1 Tax=Brachionus plicatilis TaxID=10195 RepID=A0A3M7QFE3_BRAPC|nr:actin-binding LIM 1-like [Brachionus plicatilis]
MLSLFKLKKKNKKAKENNHDDEKENTSSPTKVKKLEKRKESSLKKSSSAASPASANKEQNLILNENKSNINDEDNRKVLTSSSQNVDSARTPEHSEIKMIVQESDIKANTELHVDVSNTNQAHAAASLTNTSPMSTATTVNIHQDSFQHPRAPVLSASDAAHSRSSSNPFVRGNFMTSTISGSDLHRFLNSGYLNGDGYLQRGVEPKFTTKSPHFHRPANFSYSKNTPNYVTPGRSSHRVSASSGRVSRALSNPGVRSSSMHHDLVESSKSEVEEKSTSAETQNSTVIPVNRSIDNEEPIRLSKFSGGYEPDPELPRKIESLDWPAPPYPAAVPELRARSRSSSNRRATSTVNSINGDFLNDEDDDEDDQEVNQVLQSQGDSTDQNYQQSLAKNRQSALSAASVSSSIAKAKASRPNSKLKYQHHFFDNDYDDYLLKFRKDRDWKKTIHRPSRLESGESNVEMIEENEEKLDELEEDDEFVNEARKKLDTKLKREIQEISKIENESSMAAELLTEIKAHQQVLSRKLKIDPWKASRTPSANVEPVARTRYESPINASPSRYNFLSRGLSTTNSGHTFSHGVASSTASTTYFGEMSQVSPNSTLIITENRASTLPAGNSNTASFLTGSNFVNSSGRLTTTSTPRSGQNIVYNIPVPKPGYGLSNSNKHATLPQTTKPTGLFLSDKNIDLDVSQNTYYTSANESERVEEFKKIQEAYRQYIINNYINKTRSTPNLTGTVKV